MSGLESSYQTVLKKLIDKPIPGKVNLYKILDQEVSNVDQQNISYVV